MKTRNKLSTALLTAAALSSCAYSPEIPFSPGAQFRITTFPEDDLIMSGPYENGVGAANQMLRQAPDFFSDRVEKTEDGRLRLKEEFARVPFRFNTADLFSEEYTPLTASMFIFGGSITTAGECSLKENPDYVEGSTNSTTKNQFMIEGRLPDGTRRDGRCDIDSETSINLNLLAASLYQEFKNTPVEQIRERLDFAAEELAIGDFNGDGETNYEDMVHHREGENFYDGNEELMGLVATITDAYNSGAPYNLSQFSNIFEEANTCIAWDGVTTISEGVQVTYYSLEEAVNCEEYSQAQTCPATGDELVAVDGSSTEGFYFSSCQPDVGIYPD
jgi:hypothetical protein